MDWGTILMGLITGIAIGMAVIEYRSLPSGKTLPQEIAERAAKDERERIIAKLDKYTMYRFEKQWVIDLIEEDDE